MKFYSFIWKRISRKTKVLFVFAFFSTLLFNIITMVIPLIQRRLIRNIEMQKTGITDTFMYATVCFIGVLLMLMESVIMHLIELQIQRALQEEMFENSLKIRNSICEAKGSGALLVSIFGDSEQLATIVHNNIFELIIKLVSMIVIIIITMRWTIVFATIVISTYIIAIFLQIGVNKLFAKNFKLGREKVYECNPVVLECIENRESILGYSNFEGIKEKIYSSFNKRDYYFCKASIYNSFSQAVITSSKTIAIAIYFACSLQLIKVGRLDFATFTALFSYFSIIFTPLSMINDYISNKEKFEMLIKKIAPCIKTTYYNSIPEEEELVLDHCSYSHDGKVMQLDDISLSIDKKLAIVGLSGEGKTTIIKTLLGELVPTEGKCFLGKRDISEISKNLIYSSIRYYPQNPELYNENLEYNITLGKEPVLKKDYTKKEEQAYKEIKQLFIRLKGNTRLSDEDIALIEELFMTNKCYFTDYSFLKDLNVDEKTIEYLAKLHTAKKFYIVEKYENLLSELNIYKLNGRKLGQRGNEISGGEKNRITLARFLLPEQGTIFIMDEPFTSLDALSESLCIDVLNKYSRNLKGVIISHKIDMVSKCTDEICVLKEGKIVDKGSHDHLLASCELFRNLWEEYKKTAV